MSGVKKRFDRMTDRFAEAIDNNDPESEEGYATLVFAVVAEELEQLRSEIAPAKAAGATRAHHDPSPTEDDRFIHFYAAMQKMVGDAGAEFLGFTRAGRHGGTLAICVDSEPYTLKGEARRRTSPQAIDDAIFVDLQRKLAVVIAAARDD